MAEEIKGQEQGNEPKLDLSLINKTFETSFEDEGSLKDVFDFYKQKEDFENYRNKAGEYEKKVSELSPYKDKYETILANRDKFMPDPETIAIKQLKDKYGDVDLGVLSQVRNADLSTMNRLDALVMANKLEVKSDVSDDVRKKAILKQLGIEGSLSELEGDDLVEAKFAIDNAFAQKKSKLEEIRAFQPESTYDLETDYQAFVKSREEAKAKAEADSKTLKEYNTKMLKPILDSYKEIEIPYQDDKGTEFKAKYVVDEDFKKEFFDGAVEDLTSKGFKITTENAQEIANMINQQYWLMNTTKIVNAAVSQALSGKTEEFHKLTHSDSKTNKTEAPPGEVKPMLTAREQLRQGLLTKK